jgi:acyl-CoA synthetase (AMP-forming)/AMP-acid ligase II
VPNKTGGSDTVPLDGKELALEKMKLISSAKRRATLTFVGATLTTAEESYSNATFELQATEEPANILPPAITETAVVEQIKEEKKAEEVRVETVKPVEVKEAIIAAAPVEVKEVVIEPAPIEAKVRVDFEAVAKEYIKEHYKTQKNFKEVLGATVADVVAMLEQDLEINPPAIKAFIESKSTLLSESKPELFDFNTAVHKSLICKEIDNLIGTEWKKDKPVLNKIIELIKDLNCPMTELTATLKTLNLQAIKG